MADPQSVTIQLPKGYESYTPSAPSPIQLNPSGVKLPLGYESYVPQTRGSAETAAPYVGRLAANTLPMAGSAAFGPGGTVGGVAIKQLMQRLAPNLFGQSEDPAWDTIQSLTLNDAVPGLLGAVSSPVKTLTKAITGGGGLGAVLRKFPAAREGMVKELSNQAEGFRAQNLGGNPESQLLSTVDASRVANAPTNALQQNLASSLRDVQNGTGNYSDLADKVLKDAQTVRQFKVISGQPWVTEQLALNKLLDTGTDGSGVLDAKKILGELTAGNKEIYAEAMSPETMGSFKSLLTEMASQQKHSAADRVINYASGKLAWALPATLFGHPLGATAGAVGTLALTNSFLAKAMSNPETANLVIEAMRTSANSPKAALISHALAGVFQANNSVAGNLFRGAADIATVPDK